MGNQQQMQIPGHEFIHLDENELLDDSRVTPNQLHGNNTTHAVADKRNRALVHCEDEMPSNLNKVFDREIRERRALSITRPSRPKNRIVASEGGMTGAEGVFIAYPAVEEDKRWSGTTFFIGYGAFIDSDA